MEDAKDTVRKEVSEGVLHACETSQEKRDGLRTECRERWADTLGRISPRINVVEPIKVPSN